MAEDLIVTGRSSRACFGDRQVGHPYKMPPAPFSQLFEALPDQVGEARRAVVGYARRQGVEDTSDIALAVSEMMTNAVLHAYVGRPENGVIEVVAERRPGGGFEVRVCDDGRGMKPRPDSPGIGVGLPLAASLAASLEVEGRANGGTRVRMVFAVAG